MCGIFGIGVSPDNKINTRKINSILNLLFKLSEKRGSEASGIAIGGINGIEIFRRAMPASKMIASDEYKNFLASNLTQENNCKGLSIIGHSRLATNGSQGIEENNQPVLSNHSVGVHNGIIVNDKYLWSKHKDINAKTLLDSEVIYRLIDKYNHTQKNSLINSVIATFEEIEGEANIAFIPDAENVICLATNVGSIYYANLNDENLFIFASEKHFLEIILNKINQKREYENSIFQLRPNEAVLINIPDLSIEKFSLIKKSPIKNKATFKYKRKIIDNSPRKKELIRCVKCILPHTFPNISFDDKGICNYCNDYKYSKKNRNDELEKILNKYRSKDNSPDCIVALSGGRDSCYGLHVIKKDLRMNPIAYTYDWAMVTDEARRNSSRVCATLGVEHIIRSADIMSKRRNIRVNIDAWLKKPNLGMIPLFMAGDKQFFHYATQVSKQADIPLVIFCGGNNLEITRFKTGFCGVQDNSNNTMVGLDNLGKIKLLMFYLKNFISNPCYINRSLFDTIFAFYSTYLGRQNFLYLYKYIDWDEKKINQTLTKCYGWQSSADSSSTWRIGDGTAAFYNFIYHTVAGFSEHDTFRSNQIRAGLISREEAMHLIEKENQPRYDAMKEYASLVGFSLDEALTVINNIKKLE